jgi:hypothetical protein
MHARSLAACAAVLALAACADGKTASPVLPKTEPMLAVAPVAPRWTLYTNQAPTEILDATPGWEVGTRFRSSRPGRVIGVRFWRASGETGTNVLKVWSNGGSKLAQATIASSGSGWVEARLLQPVAITANTTYRVSVNTNTKQAKKGGAYVFDGPLSNGPLYSDGGYYGQPTGVMPNTESASYFFVDVLFEEDVPLPNLYVQPGVSIPESPGAFSVCNNGQAVAGASTTRVRQTINTGSIIYQQDQYLPTSTLAAGSCQTFGLPAGPAGSTSQYGVSADVYDVVYESNEGDNFRSFP